MFKKPKRNFRARQHGDSNPEEQNGPSTGNMVAQNEGANNENVVKTEVMDCEFITIDEVKPKKKKKKTEKEKGMKQSSSVLSFEDDEGDEEEVFKIKKSSHSKKYTKQLKKELQKEKESQEQRKLEQDQLKPKRQKPKKVKTDATHKVTEDLKNGDASGSASPGSVGPGSDIDFSDNEEATFAEKLRSGEIPDASIIHAIRKKRQMAREMGDFIPVDDTVKFENDKSRLVREDENDDSDEDEDRINFTVSSSSVDSNLRKIQQTILEAHEESHSDGSDQEWEKQQILKGVSIPAQQITTNVNNEDNINNYYGGVQDYLFGNGNQTSAFSMAPEQPYQTSAPVKRTIPVSDLPKINLELVITRLKERLEEMSVVHRSHTAERKDLTSRVETCCHDIETLSGNTEKFEKQYRFFQEMRGYVTDLVECINAKIPQVQYLERSLFKLWQKRAEKLVQRRQQDVKDESHDAMMNASKSSVEPSQDLEKQRRMAEREARRTRRRRKRQKLQTDSEHIDGMSTDDEQNPSEFAHFNSEKERITTEAERLFEDVEDEFSRLENVKHRFERWRDEQGDSYNDAYIALCLPKLFTPFVKLKLIGWNPLEFRCADFLKEPWYETLMFYGHQDQHEVVSNDDIKVMPSIVEKVLLPKLTGLVESVWDPMFTRQTERLVKVITYFMSQYPTLTSDSKNTKALIKAVVTRIRTTLDDDIFMPLYPKQVLENKGPASMFFNRQLTSCIKLLSNILLWNGIIGKKALQEMALDALLNRYIMLGMQNSIFNQTAIGRCQQISSKLPVAWFESLKESDSSTIPQLETFCRYLSHSIAALEATTAGKSREHKEARNMVKQITKMLVNIHAMDHAMAMASKFSLKLLTEG